MLFLRFLLFVGCFGLGALAAGMVLYDIFLAYELDRDSAARGPRLRIPRRRRRHCRRPWWSPATRAARDPVDSAAKFVAIAAVMGLAGTSIVVVPDGARRGAHQPDFGRASGNALRGNAFHRSADRSRFALRHSRPTCSRRRRSRSQRQASPVLTVEAREGLTVGLAVNVRYRIDSRSSTTSRRTCRSRSRRRLWSRR